MARLGEALTGTIVGTHDGELLVAGSKRGTLHLIDVTSGADRFTDNVAGRVRGLRYHAFVPSGDPDVIIAIGHFPGEGRDTIVTLSLRGLLTEGADYLNRSVYPSGFSDDAYVVAAGPGADGEVICYRDPEDDEDDEETEEDRNHPHRPKAYGISGYFGRRLADPAFAGPSVAGAAPVHELLVATAHTVLARVAGGVQVIPRDGRPPTLVPAAVAALDSGTACAVLSSADSGDLRLLTVA